MSGNAVARWRQMYNESAGARSWLQAHRWTYGPQVAQATIADVRRKLELKPDDRVLEVGAGCGAFLMGLLHERQNGIGVDICESLIRESGRLGVDGGKVRLAVAEGLFLPIPSETFDKVLCYSVAHHFPTPEYARGVLHQLLRVCRPGGIILLGDVSGVMERHRKMLIDKGLPPALADGLLSPLLPLRHLRWLRARKKCQQWPSTFSRRFFHRTLRSVPCDFEILDQNIPGRRESLGRFDVRIVKKNALHRCMGNLCVLAWTVAECVRTFALELGLPGHG